LEQPVAALGLVQAELLVGRPQQQRRLAQQLEQQRVLEQERPARASLAHLIKPWPANLEVEQPQEPQLP
jgi:hypothetical protein